MIVGLLFPIPVLQADMTRSSRTIRLPKLDTRFLFSEVSFAAAPGSRKSTLFPVTGVADGERYLMRIFRKTGTDVDADLLNLIHRGLRRVHRVLSSRQARDVLVEITEVVEDDEEIGILMLDPGTPVQATSQRRKSQQSQYLVGAGRIGLWRNLGRIAQAIGHCHDAGIVHGSVGVFNIFTQGDGREDFRLGGYEACINIADPDLTVADALMSPTTAVSFRQDWIDLGRAASEMLGMANDNPPPLSSIERRFLDRLNGPPEFQLFDSKAVRQELEEVVSELSKAGASADGELVVYPGTRVLRGDLAALTSGTIAAGDVDEVLRFVENDLQGPDIKLLMPNPQTAFVFTDLAFYTLDAVDRRIGQIRNAQKRRPDDRSIYEAAQLPYRFYLARDRRGADERVLRLGPAAKAWEELRHQPKERSTSNDDPVWFALILLEAFTLLREQHRIYPIKVVEGEEAGPSKVLVQPRLDSGLDHQRELAGLPSIVEALDRELANDDGKANWTLARTDSLAGDRERAPQLTFDGIDIISGRRAYAFTSSEPILAPFCNFLRPRRDSGTENAVRRRLNNIVSARTNLDLLRSMDDPAQVALDDGLQMVAGPGEAPDGMDDTKTLAWESIRQGQSINVIVGPPGVGKTYLISNLVKSILALTPDARILVAAQNHDTLIHMQAALDAILTGQSAITVRIERSQTEEADRAIRKLSVDLLSKATEPLESVLVNHQIRRIGYALAPVDPAQQAISEQVHRDTETLLVRSADVTLATTSSYAVEDMIADGEQFDWTIIEEAARANGSELTGALLLGNRRVMIGDHNQLSPFDHAQRVEMYESGKAAAFLSSARSKLATFADLPPAVDEALGILEASPELLSEVLAISARLEEPFRAIAERESERELATGRPSRHVKLLTEQSRMHPAICEVVSNTFYRGKLTSSDRVRVRASAVRSVGPLPDVPIVILDMPALSKVDKPWFESRPGRSLRNDTEAKVILEALPHLRPIPSKDGKLPTLAILAPYKAQVGYLKELLSRQPVELLSGFTSPRSDGEFVFTSDSFQGSEADVVFATLVRNNVMVGARALGFMRSPQRLNVLLSRAKHKLVLVTSLDFIVDAVNGVDPDQLGGDLGFLREMVKEFRRQAEELQHTRILRLDANGRVKA